MLEEQINNDYKQAMRDRDSIKSSTLNFLRAQFKNHAISNKSDKLEDADAVSVIKKQVKQRQDSIEQFEKGGRTDLADKEKAELEILQGYLPEEMSDEALKGIVEEAVKEAGASSMKDMGNVMKVVMPKVSGQADNKRVSDLVKQTLSNL